MAFCDFVVYYDPNKDSKDELAKRILYSIIIKRIKAKKPCVMFVGGDSGEGKSYTTVRLQEILLELQGLKASDYFDAINCYTPLQYPKKLDNLLFNKEVKKANIIAMHEAREIVKAKDWQNFLTQAVADVNAMSRSVKRLIIIIVSQFIRDITRDMRYTLNFYCTVKRPKNKPARLYINVLWKDDRDLESPKLKKRKLSGYLIYPNGQRRRFVPSYFEMKKPHKDLIKIFEEQDYKAKAGIIKRKINDLIKTMKEDIGEESDKINSMVDWYIEHPDTITLIGKRYRGKWKLQKKVREMHNLTDMETKKFEVMLNDKLRERGVIENEE